MPEVGQITIKASLDGQDFNLGIDQMKSLMQGVVKDADDAQLHFSGLGKELLLTGAAALGLSGVIEGVKDSLQGIAKEQDAQMMLTSLMGSAQDAADEMKQLKDITAGTPIEISGILDATVQLESAGTAAVDLTDIMVGLENASGGSVQKLNDLAQALSMAEMQGQASTRTMRAFANDGVPMLKLLAQEYGVTTAQMNQMLSAGEIGYPQLKKVIDDFYTGTGKYADRMSQYAENLGGAYNQTKNIISEFSKSIMENAVPSLISLLKGIGSAVQWLGSLSQTTKDSTINVLIMSAGIATAIKVFSSWPAILAMAQTALKAFQAAMALVTANPIMAVIVALALLSAAFAEPLAKLTLFREEYDQLEKTQKDYASQVNFTAQQEIKLTGHIQDQINMRKMGNDQAVKWLETLDKMIDQMKSSGQLTSANAAALTTLRKEVDRVRDSYANAGVQTKAWLEAQKKVYDEALGYEKKYNESSEEGLTEMYNKKLADLKKYQISHKMSEEEYDKVLTEMQHEYLEAQVKLAEQQKTFTGGTIAQWKAMGNQMAETMASTMTTMSDQLAAGTTTIKKAMKEMLISMVDMIEKEILMQIIRNAAAALAFSIESAGTSLLFGAANNAELLGLLAGAEGMKAGIRAMATGGLVTGPTNALIGEGRDNEAVLPLNSDVYNQLARGILSQIPAATRQSPESRQAVQSTIGGYAQTQRQDMITSSDIHIGLDKVGKVITKVSKAGLGLTYARSIVGAPT